MQESKIGTVDLSDIPNLGPGSPSKHEPSFSVKARVDNFIALFGINIEAECVRSASHALCHQYAQYGTLNLSSLTTLAGVVTAPLRKTIVEKMRGWEKAFTVEAALAQQAPKRGQWQSFLKREAPYLANEIWRTFMKDGKLVYDIEPSEMHIGYDRRSGVLTLAGPHGAANILHDHRGARWA